MQQATIRERGPDGPYGWCREDGTSEQNRNVLYTQTCGRCGCTTDQGFGLRAITGEKEAWNEPTMCLRNQGLAKLCPHQGFVLRTIRFRVMLCAQSAGHWEAQAEELFAALG